MEPMNYIGPDIHKQKISYCVKASYSSNAILIASVFFRNSSNAKNPSRPPAFQTIEIAPAENSTGPDQKLIWL